MFYLLRNLTCPVIFVLVSLFTLNEAKSQSYCIPPKFKSGPYTGIVGVRLNQIDNNTGYNSGYIYYKSITSPKLSKAYPHPITVKIKNTLGTLQNTVVWIDWNQDKDFKDPDEEVIFWKKHNPDNPVKHDIEVPATAKNGVTRMRVYTDMSEEEGHISPRPCGYKNSSNPIGQHGEIEDYQVEVVTTSSISSANDQKRLSYISYNTTGHPMLRLNIVQKTMVKITLYNYIGKKVETLKNQYFVAGDHEINVHQHTRDLPYGLYFLNISADKNNQILKFYSHLQ